MNTIRARINYRTMMIGHQEEWKLLPRCATDALHRAETTKRRKFVAPNSASAVMEHHEGDNAFSMEDTPSTRLLLLLNMPVMFNLPLNNINNIAANDHEKLVSLPFPPITWQDDDDSNSLLPLQDKERSDAKLSRTQDAVTSLAFNREIPKPKSMVGTRRKQCCLRRSLACKEHLWSLALEGTHIFASNMMLPIKIEIDIDCHRNDTQ
jgi:hypothetical protein